MIYDQERESLGGVYNSAILETLHTETDRPSYSEGPENYLSSDLSAKKFSLEEETSTAQILNTETSFTRKRVKTPKFVARLLEHASKKELKIENLTQKLDRDSVSECTFYPRTNRNKSKRSLKEFLNDQSSFISQKQLKIDRKLEEREKLINKALFTPNLNTPASHFYPSKRHSCSIITENYSLEPKIKNLSGKTGKTNKNIQSKSTPVFVNKSSSKMIVDKFKTEFESLFAKLTMNGDLNYSLFIILLTEMRFITGKDKERANLAWKLLGKTDQTYLDKSRLLDFLLKVMNYSDTYSRIHSKFRDFYVNRNKKVEKKSPSETKKPRKVSLDLSKCKFEDDFRRKIERNREEMHECTFSPQINQRRSSSHKELNLSQCWDELNSKSLNKSVHRAITLYSNSVLKQERKKQELLDSLQISSIQSTPRLRISILKDKKKPADAKGVPELINRLKKAREKIPAVEFKSSFVCGLGKG